MLLHIIIRHLLENANMGKHTKIDGKYEQPYTERLRQQIEDEDSITLRHRLISKYLYQRIKQTEKVIANIEDDDIDLTMVIEQLREDLMLAKEQISNTAVRSDFYAKYYGIDKKHRKGWYSKYVC